MSDKLTPEQIKNWRKVLCLQIGPAAFFLSDNLIQRYKDKLQNDIDKEKERENNERQKS